MILTNDDLLLFVVFSFENCSFFNIIKQALLRFMSIIKIDLLNIQLFGKANDVQSIR